MFDLSANHTATVSKDRTSLFDGQIFKLSQETGCKLKEWLDSGLDVERMNRLYKSYLERFGGNADQTMTEMLRITEGRVSREWTQEDLSSLEAVLEA